MNAQTKRNLKFILLVTLTLIVVILVFVQRESPILRGDSVYAKDDSGIQKRIKLRVWKRNAEESLGRANLYPDYYGIMEDLRATGISEGNAARKTRIQIIEQNALCYAAYRQGFKFGITGYEKFIRLGWDNFKKSAHFAKLSRLYEDCGTTLRKEYMHDSRYNRMNYILTTWNHGNSKMNNAARRNTGVSKIAELLPQIYYVHDEVTPHIEKMIGEYMQSKEAKKLELALRRCEKIYHDYGSNIDGINRYKEDLNAYSALN